MKRRRGLSSALLAAAIVPPSVVLVLSGVVLSLLGGRVILFPAGQLAANAALFSIVVGLPVLSLVRETQLSFRLGTGALLGSIFAGMELAMRGFAYSLDPAWLYGWDVILVVLGFGIPAGIVSVFLSERYVRRLKSRMPT